MTVPDYDLPATLAIEDAAAHAALGDPRRNRIVALLSERAATTKQLAAAIDRSPQATTHHLEVLAEAGLVRVVRTDRVRATTRRWWGRTARVFVLRHDGEVDNDGMLREAQAEIAAARDVDAGGGGSTIRYARIPPDRADEWFQRFVDLVDEFAEQPRSGDLVHGVVVQVFATAWSTLDATGEGAAQDPPPENTAGSTGNEQERA